MATRFAAQQEIQLNLIEQESTDLKDHIQYWASVRLENVLGYYARKEGITSLGLQPLPVLAVLQYKAKEAIHLQLLLTSLSKSQYASEEWTLSQCSAEIINTPPKNCFKKQAFTVTVLFDNNPNNTFPYTCWDFIYYQDDASKWHKVQGNVDVNGIYYKETSGDIVYFTLFAADSERYGQTGLWTIKYKNETIFASVDSSNRAIPGPSSEASRRPASQSPPQSKTSRKRTHETDENTDRESPTSTSSGIRLRRRDQQGESTPRKQQRPARRGLGSAPSPEEVGRGTRSVPRTGLTGLRRLQEEARDPFLVLLTGCPNSLKCFRYRCQQRYASLYIKASTVFHWVSNDSESPEPGRLLIAFSSSRQRDIFLASVTIPKGTHYCFGNLDCM